MENFTRNQSVKTTIGVGIFTAENYGKVVVEHLNLRAQLDISLGKYLESKGYNDLFLYNTNKAFVLIEKIKLKDYDSIRESEELKKINKQTDDLFKKLKKEFETLPEYNELRKKEKEANKKRLFIQRGLKREAGYTMKDINNINIPTEDLIFDNI